MRLRLEGVVRRVASRVGARIVWVELAGAAIVVVVAAGLVGRSAVRQAASLDAEAVRLERVLRGADRWVAEYHAPSPAESTRWQRSEQELRGLSVGVRDQAMLLHELARRAEVLGVTRVWPTIIAGDSAPPMAPLQVGAWSIEPGEVALGVELEADYATVYRYIGSLPPRLRVRRLRLDGQGGTVRAYLLLTTYRVVGGDDAHDAAAQADAGDRDVRRTSPVPGAPGAAAAGSVAARRGPVAGSGRTGGAGGVRDAGRAGGGESV